MRRRNATTVFLKECIADALIRLMAHKPFDKITIQEIVEQAHVGRATYFRNFSSKYEVITYKLVRLWKRWAEEHQFKDEDRYSLDHAEHFFAFNASIRDLHQRIYAAGLQATIFDAFYQIMRPPPDADALELYRNRFLSYGLFGLLDEWIQRGYRESPKEMARMVVQNMV